MIFSKNLGVLKFLFVFLVIVSCSRNDDSSNNGSSNKPPDNFVLLEIRNNSLHVSLNPRFYWGRAADPDGDSVRYSLLMEQGNGTPNIVLASGLQTTDFTVNTSLEFNTLYSWQVIASDENGGTTYSDIFSFTTRKNLSPENFNLLQVPDKEKNIVLNPKLTWENAIDPDGEMVTYEILLDEGNDNPTTIIANDLQQTSYAIPSNLDHNTSYFWKVIASDNQGNSIASEVFLFTTRMFRETLVTSEAQFSTRTEHSLIEFNDKLWVIGGYHASNGSVNGGLMNDVWSSFDGITWTKEVPNNSSTSFTPRAKHATVVFQEKIWIIGGGSLDSPALSDVWSSPDGTNWTKETDNAGFTGRAAHQVFVFNNQIWMIGGSGINSRLADVWSTYDGINWTLRTGNAPFGMRSQHTSTGFQGKIWVIGGIGNLGNLNDVWSSTDGINWSLETISADFAPRRGHSSVVYKDRIWVIAGNLRNDLWSSKDGVNWNQETEIIYFRGRGEQASSIFNNKIWIIGGWMGSLLNDVWVFD